MNTLARPALFLAALALAVPAAAHTVWLMPERARPGGWHVLFGGHAGAIDPYPAAKLKAVTALAADGKSLAVSRAPKADGVHLTIAGKPSMILAHYDNGIHTKRSDGPSVEKPMNMVPRALSATRAVKWHKTIAAWAPIVTRPAGQPFELVPMAATQPIAGKPMLVKVLVGGKPAAGVKVSRNEEGAEAVSDSRGIARFVPQAGYNKIWSGARTPVKGNPAYTENSIEYSFGFFAK
jgi:nickel transport protein